MAMAIIDPPEIMDKQPPIFGSNRKMLQMLNLQDPSDIIRLLENEFNGPDNGRWIFYI